MTTEKRKYSWMSKYKDGLRFPILSHSSSSTQSINQLISQSTISNFLLKRNTRFVFLGATSIKIVSNSSTRVLKNLIKMHFFTSLTTLLFTTLALGAAIDTRDNTDNTDNFNPGEDFQNQSCSPEGGACGQGQAVCCAGLRCYIPPKSGWEPAGPWNTNQGACIV
jgi:hypothetical protein